MKHKERCIQQNGQRRELRMRERERSGVKETRDKRLLGKRRRRNLELRRKAYRQKKGINSQSQGASPFVSSQ